MVKTRLFKLKWDNSNVSGLAAVKFRERNNEGVVFSNGLVALSGGGGYNDLAEMTRILNRHGKFSMTDMAGHPLELENEHAQTA
jgi:hypothetical protein